MRIRDLRKIYIVTITKLDGSTDELRISASSSENACYAAATTSGRIGYKYKAVVAVKSRRSARDQAMRDLGLVKVRGALGGTYWE